MISWPKKLKLIFSFSLINKYFNSKVFQANLLYDKTIYALKVVQKDHIDKEYVTGKQYAELLILEKKIGVLSQKSRFLVHLKAAFQNDV